MSKVSKKPKESKYPNVSRGLIEYLERKFPNKLPSETITDMQKELYLRLGEQRVLKHLRTIQNYNEKKDASDIVHSIDP